MIGENGRTVFAQMETYTVGGVKKYIRNDLGGHLFKDGVTMGRHFNAGLITQTLYYFRGIRCVQNILQKTSWKMLNK